MLSPSWQKTLTTFCPAMVSSMKPFSVPRFFCCDTKFLPEIPLAIPDTSIVTTTIKRLIRVNGMLSTAIITTMVTTVTKDCTICIMLWEIICLRVSTSFV